MRNQFTLFILVWAVTGVAGKTAAEPPDRIDYSNSPVVKKLAQPFSTVAQGHSADRLLRQIATSTDLNLWIDRRLDASVELDATTLRPNLWAVISGISDQIDANVMVIDNVVLIGRAGWLDRNLLARRTGLPSTTGSSQMVQLAWPDLITPSELAELVGRAGPLGTAQLAAADLQSRPGTGGPWPYDLWPGGTLTDVAGDVVLRLIDQQFAPPDIQPADATAESFPVCYTTKLSHRRFTRAVQSADSDVRIVSVEEGFVITGRGAAHRAAMNLVLEATLADQKHSIAGANKAAGHQVITVELEDVPAGTVLQSIAAASGKQCEIRPAAKSAANKRISLQAVQQDPKTVAADVARQAGLSVTWGVHVVTVDLADQ